MSRRIDRAALLPIAVERAGDIPMHRQIYEEVRALILDGRLARGTRLPSTRALAGEFGVSRNTAQAAYDQLLAEGYIEGRVGAGSFVAGDLPEDSLAGLTAPPRADSDADAGMAPRPRRDGLSRRGAMLASLSAIHPGRGAAFTPGVPDMTAFPFDVWARLMARSWRRPPTSLLTKGDPGGHPPLRAAIAGYLRTARGVRCAAEQVIVVAGAQQAIGLAAHVLCDEGDRALLEEPGYPGVRGALLAAGLVPAAAPVDDEGLDIARAEAAAPDARLACVAPSHQYPLGVTLSLPRRLALLDWAARRGGWIVEDDYDSEYRYAGRPLAALQGMDRTGRVVYVGTFSKVLFPSLRVGYLVVPEDLVDAFLRARRALDDHPSSVAQPALTAFIQEGHFAAHIRRMRKLYAARQRVLVAAIRETLPKRLSVDPAPAGMHLVARFAGPWADRDDVAAAMAVARAGVTAYPLSSCFAEGTGEHGFLLGYAAVPEEEIPAKLATLAEAMDAAA